MRKERKESEMKYTTREKKTWNRDTNQNKGKQKMKKRKKDRR